MDTSTQRAETTTGGSNRSRRQQLRIAGAALILLAGVIHLALVPEHLEETTYLGVLFAANFVAAVVAAYGIYRGRDWGWWLGAVVAVIAIVAYIANGTVGLPMTESEGLLEPAGVVTKIIEFLFLGVTAVWMGKN